MTIHLVSDIKHYIPFNYIHHMQHLFKSPRSVCHGVLLMARAIQARIPLSTLTYERASTFPNVNSCTFWQHQHVSISCSSSENGDRTVVVQFLMHPFRQSWLVHFPLHIIHVQLVQPVLQLNSQQDLHHISISSQHSEAFMLCFMGLPYMLRNAVHAFNRTVHLQSLHSSYRSSKPKTTTVIMPWFRA